MGEEAERIRVYAKVRRATAYPTLVVSKNSVALSSEGNRGPKCFTFNGVFDDSCAQHDVFDAVARPIVSSCLDGVNGTILTYGESGSGKTHTMYGPASCGGRRDSMLDEGIIPQSIRFLFDLLERKQSEGEDAFFASEVGISFVEIYNEKVFDLLASNKRRRLSSVHSIGKSSTREKWAGTSREALKIMARGLGRRSVDHDASSRSHAVFTIKVRTVHRVKGVETKRTSCVNLVDLAGSECVAATKATDRRVVEAGHINKSLLELGRLTMILSSARKQTRHISYRNSLLTFLLRDAFGGNSRTAFIITAHNDRMHYTETRRTLMFSELVRLIKNRIVRNEVIMSGGGSPEEEAGQTEESGSDEGEQGEEVAASTTGSEKEEEMSQNNSGDELAAVAAEEEDPKAESQAEVGVDSVQTAANEDTESEGQADYEADSVQAAAADCEEMTEMEAEDGEGLEHEAAVAADVEEAPRCPWLALVLIGRAIAYGTQQLTLHIVGAFALFFIATAYYYHH